MSSRSRHRFTSYVGIDYSGAKGPDDALPGLAVAELDATGTALPREPPDGARRWSRKALADWLADRLTEPTPTVVGIDHAFSYPASVLRAKRLASWDEFLERCVARWGYDADRVRPEQHPIPKRAKGVPPRRLTDECAGSAQSVFKFVGPGQVGYATHAGLPWLRQLRTTFRGSVHFWPFDGWEIPRGRSAIVEVYPAILRPRFPPAASDVGPMSRDETDARSVARWMYEADRAGRLGQFLDPLIAPTLRAQVELEGWILGVP